MPTASGLSVFGSGREARPERTRSEAATTAPSILDPATRELMSEARSVIEREDKRPKKAQENAEEKRRQQAALQQLSAALRKGYLESPGNTVIVMLNPHRRDCACPICNEQLGDGSYDARKQALETHLHAELPRCPSKVAIVKPPSTGSFRRAVERALGLQPTKLRVQRDKQPKPKKAKPVESSDSSTGRGSSASDEEDSDDAASGEEGESSESTSSESGASAGGRKRGTRPWGSPTARGPPQRQLSAYEQQRNARIEANRAQLADLAAKSGTLRD